jgi:hypothetical protein
LFLGASEASGSTLVTSIPFLVFSLVQVIALWLLKVDPKNWTMR